MTNWVNSGHGLVPILLMEMGTDANIYVETFCMFSLFSVLGQVKKRSLVMGFIWFNKGDISNDIGKKKLQGCKFSNKITILN